MTATFVAVLALIGPPDIASGDVPVPAIVEPSAVTAEIVRVALKPPPPSHLSGEHASDGAAVTTERPLRLVIPVRWLKTRRRQCRRYRGRRYCDGPLRVPEPRGAPAELAEQLGIGTLKAASRLLREPASPDWVQAVEGQAEETLLWPVAEGTFWRGFGWTRKHRRRRLHKGVDIGAPVGTPIRAANDGMVVYSHNGVKGYGNLIMMLHPDGSVTYYAHCRATYVFPGQQVQRGQIIGEVGQTGLARGPHLHFEWRWRGRPRSPQGRFAGLPDDPRTATLAQRPFRRNRRR